MRLIYPLSLCVVVAIFANSAHADEAVFPTYDKVFGSSTHNSYWIRHGWELAASGTQERILDQLLYDHVRALEFDIHRRTNHPGVWSIYHTNKESNSLCSPLTECLKQLQLFQYLVPRHEVVNIIIEFKELLGRALSRGHTVENLDALLRRYLGDALYTPRDFLSRCPAGFTMRACARLAGWPAVDALRGKFIINILGNWSYNFHDWVEYATWGRGVSDRVAFPMRTIYNPHGTARLFGYIARTQVEPHRVQAANDASIFWQVGDIDYNEIQAFLAEHGVMRSPESSTAQLQRYRIGRGFQMIQTNQPSQFVQADPAQRLSSLYEPGNRIHLVAHEDGYWATAAQASTAEVDEWETMPSTTRRSGQVSSGIGCLRAASRDNAQSFLVCRQVVKGEVARVSVRVRRAGDAPDLVLGFDSTTPSAGVVGDLIALHVARALGGSCVDALSASAMQGARPDWHPIARECFDGDLVDQGLAARGDVLFVGTRHNQRAVSDAELIIVQGGPSRPLSLGKAE